ncbi:hypothetical protein ZIOFF_072211 [Zingiber officinale]|uniref:40S ribosomal protein S19 n=1 Tax=Zingiber officinale TaxID=94328 RepID=A0A8J5C9T0_ZINOF|nr:hypothetical protein ZIOFF_072211 [Zingiber officinale]
MPLSCEWLHERRMNSEVFIFVHFGLPMSYSTTIDCGLFSVKQMELPEWTDIVKTGRFKELAPYDPDWYYIRAASMARKIYLSQGIGVGGFQKIYGGRKRNGSRPPHFCKSSGAIARHILQQLETMNIIEINPKGAMILFSVFEFSGRKISSQGQRDLDQVAGRV